MHGKKLPTPRSSQSSSISGPAPIPAAIVWTCTSARTLPGFLLDCLFCHINWTTRGHWHSSPMRWRHKIYTAVQVCELGVGKLKAFKSEKSVIWGITKFGPFFKRTVFKFGPLGVVFSKNLRVLLASSFPKVQKYESHSLIRDFLGSKRVAMGQNYSFSIVKVGRLQNFFSAQRKDYASHSVKRRGWTSQAKMFP